MKRSHILFVCTFIVALVGFGYVVHEWRIHQEQREIRHAAAVMSLRSRIDYAIQTNRTADVWLILDTLKKMEDDPKILGVEYLARLTELAIMYSKEQSKVVMGALHRTCYEEAFQELKRIAQVFEDIGGAEKLFPEYAKLRDEYQNYPFMYPASYDLQVPAICNVG